MNNLYEMINVSTNENDAIGQYASITHEEWGNMASCDEIHTSLESLGVSYDNYDMYFEGVQVIENALNNSYPNESVFFWID